jgi:hypothetical protein
MSSAQNSLLFCKVKLTRSELIKSLFLIQYIYRLKRIRMTIMHT